MYQSGIFVMCKIASSHEAEVDKHKYPYSRGMKLGWSQEKPRRLDPDPPWAAGWAATVLTITGAQTTASAEGKTRFNKLLLAPLLLKQVPSMALYPEFNSGLQPQILALPRAPQFGWHGSTGHIQPIGHL